MQIRTETIVLQDGNENLLILHFSDIHVWFSGKILEKAEKEIHIQKPDLIVFTGDYADTPHGLKLFSMFLRRISQTFISVFIRGNHDFMFGKKISGLLMNIPNCHCVEEEPFMFTSAAGNKYRFVSWQSRHHLCFDKRIKNVILVHNPEKLKENEFQNIDLIFAGHLHGGQFIFHKSKSNSFFPGNILYKYCTDRKEVLGTTIIVNKGLGDTLPLRWNCPKEIVRVIVN